MSNVRLGALLAAALLAACDSPTLPVSSPPPADGAPVQASAAPAAQQRGQLRTHTPWRKMNDAELAARVAEAGGRVFVGFREPGAPEGVDERGRVLVSDATVRAAKAELRAQGIPFEMEYTLVPAVVARLRPEQVARVRAHPRVEYVEPIFPGEWLVQDTPWNVTRVNAPAAWPYSSGAGQKVLIIDSGIQQGHPDLSPAVWNNCDGTNGLDQFGHGTSVAGVAAAVNDDDGIIGGAWGVSLWSAKIGTSAPDPAAAACAVQFGRTNGTFAMNISAGMSPYTPLTDQINGAYNQNGLLVVVAAGNTNGGAVSYPATLDAAIAVTATDANNARASFAAVGSKVELAAPGVGVWTTCHTGLGPAYCSVDGTSFSAPAVAAAAALLKAYNPSWTNVEIRRRLGAGATDLGPLGRDSQFGYGLLNVLGAINANPPAPLTVSVDGPSQVKPGAQCGWWATASGGNGAYSYEWTVNGVWVGSGYELIYTNDRFHGETFTLAVHVQDTAGGTGSWSNQIAVSSQAMVCPF